MSGTKQFFNLEGCIENYLRHGSDDYHGCKAFAAGETLDRNSPEGKRNLRGVVSGFKKMAEGIARDAMLLRVPLGK